tara:strand:- start:175 stop:657 length:483 start_codon:yes stop_codon:yes gene_type:complete
MHYKQNNKESKTYVQGLRPFVNTLPRGIKGILKKNGYNYSEIVGKWKSLVGKDISDFAHPKSIKISKNQKNGILILQVKRGNEITIEYSKKEIIEKINSFFGYKLIGQIKLETVNSETKKIKDKGQIKKFSYDFEKKIKEIKNKEIRKSLSNLLNSMKNA